MLRNFVRERFGYNSGHTLYVKDLRDISEGLVQGAGKYADSICDHLASYSARKKTSSSLLLTADELSLGGSGPYTSTDKTNKNKYT